MRNGYGVSNGDELLLMFTMPKLPPPMGTGPVSDRDKKVSFNLLRMWTNFAKMGRPTGPKEDAQWVPSVGPDHL